MSKVIVTGYRTFSFEDEKSGKKLEGVKVSFLGKHKASSTNEYGHLPLQSTVDLSLLDSFKEVPGIYEAESEMVPGKGNKPTLAIIGFEFIKGVDLNALFK